MDIASLGSSPNADPIVETIIEHGLERNIVELDAYGFTVIPPEKLGTPPDFAERVREAVLDAYRRRHDVEIDVNHSSDLPADNRLYKQLIDEDDAITEAVVHPVTLAMARWHCGQSAVLGQTSSIIKPPGPKHRLPLHNDTHGVPPPQAAYSQVVNTSWVLTDYAGVDDGPNRLRARQSPLGSCPDATGVAVLGGGRADRAAAAAGEGRLAGRLERQHLARRRASQDARPARHARARLDAHVHEAA